MEKADRRVRGLLVVCAKKAQDFTPDEMLVLASLRRSSGRTCARCAWLVSKGPHKGCYPLGKYKKWLSEKEYQAGCEQFSASEERPA